MSYQDNNPTIIKVDNKELREDIQNVSSQLAQNTKETIENKRAVSYWWNTETQPPARTDLSGWFIDAFNKTAPEYITDDLEPIRLSNPDYITRTNLGKDQSGEYDIWKYEFTPKNYKKTIVIDSCTHGGEITNFIAMLRFFHYLVNEWEKYPQLAYIREHVHIVYIPFVNPWGVSQKPRQRYNSSGVDINRNFDYKWEQYNDTIQPYEHGYKGSSPFSEVETRIVRDNAMNYPDAIAYLTLHNTGDPIFDFYYAVPENYQYKLVDRLVEYLSEKWGKSSSNVSKDSSDKPSTTNYITQVLKLPTIAPEWCDKAFGDKAYDSTEITYSLMWYANVIIEHCREFEKIPQPFVKERYFTSQGTSITVSATTATTINQFDESIEIKSDGIVTFDGFVVAIANAGSSVRATITPKLGQTGSTPAFGENVPVRWESYADIPAGSRLTIPFIASMPVKKSDTINIGLLGIGLRAYVTGTGTFNIARYRGRLTFTPSNTNNFDVKQITL